MVDLGEDRDGDAHTRPAMTAACSLFTCFMNLHRERQERHNDLAIVADTAAATTTRRRRCCGTWRRHRRSRRARTAHTKLKTPKGTNDRVQSAGKSHGPVDGGVRFGRHRSALAVRPVWQRLNQDIPSDTVRLTARPSHPHGTHVSRANAKTVSGRHRLMPFPPARATSAVLSPLTGTASIRRASPRAVCGPTPQTARELARRLEAVPVSCEWTADVARTWWERHQPVLS